MIGAGISTSIGLTIGNFLYQVIIPNGSYLEATERSVFQTLAIISFIIVLRKVG
jgi:hypothetical protein